MVSGQTAFVLSGGGNYGALQVGALKALLERGIAPDLLIGTSAGAINAAYFASQPTAAGVDRLAQVWVSVRREDIYPGTQFHIIWRVLTGSQSLFPSQAFYKFLVKHMPHERLTFGDLTQPRLFITAAHLDTGELHLYGEKRDELVIEAIMSSSALPPFSPPWRGSDGHLHVDGGSVSDLPIGIALKKGARNIYALHIQEVTAREQRLRSMAEIGHCAIRALLKVQLANDLAIVRAQRNVRMHYIPLRCPPDVAPFDFSRSAHMIANGYEQTQAYFDALPKPASTREQLSARAQRSLQRLSNIWKPKYVTLGD